MFPPITFTPLLRALLGGLFLIYVVQLVLQGTLEPWLVWQPFGAGFQPWQVFSAFLLNGEPLGAVFDWLTLYFTVPALEQRLGPRRLGNAALTVWAFAVVAGLLGSATGLVQGAFLGSTPLAIAALALFGFQYAEAQIRLFMLIPIRAIVLAWASGLISFLYMLYGKDLGSTLVFFAWVGTYYWSFWGDGLIRRVRLRFQQQRAARRVAGLRVFEGGRGRSGSGDWVN